MKRRSLALLLALAFVLTTVFTGCGDVETTATEEAETTVEESTEVDYSAYEYGEIDYSADITGIDMSLVESPMSEIDRETLEYAIQQVCLAYYYKGSATQYDLGRQSYDAKNDSYRRTTGQSPEDTEWDSCWYSQCAEFCYDVYVELCGYEYKTCGTIRTVPDTFKADAASVPFSSGTMGWDVAKVTQLILYDARPGDIFYSNGTSGSGHLIMIVGDLDGDGENDCLHCWPYQGGTMRLPMDTEDADATFQSGTAGDQKWDTYGVVLQSARSLIINTTKTNGMPLWSAFTTSSDKMWKLIRVFEQSDIGTYHLSTDTVTRITYEGIEVSKVPEGSIHQSVLQGDEIVITETITNNGKSDFTGLNVTEYIPDGTEYVTSDNGTLNGRKIQWTVDVPAGESVSFTYTVKVMYGAGMEITVPAGLVAGLQTRTFVLQVGQSEFTEEQLNTMLTIAETKKYPEGVELKKAAELDFVNEFYKQVLGKEIALPSTVNELMEAFVYEDKSINGCAMASMLFRKEDTTGYEALNQMLIRNMIGGYYYSTGAYTSVQEYTVKRLIDIREGYLMPGDVFIAFDGDSKRSLESTGDLKIYIYLGNGMVAARIGTGTGVMTYDQTIDQILSQNFLIALRPNLYY